MIQILFHLRLEAFSSKIIKKFKFWIEEIENYFFDGNTMKLEDLKNFWINFLVDSKYSLYSHDFHGYNS